MTTLRTSPPLRRYLRHGTLPQLATFEAVLRLRSATRAAEAMCIAQPTLSGHLRKLSEAVGVPLFKMQGKHLAPTDAALVLLQTSHEIFAALERCELALAHYRRDVRASSTSTATATATATATMIVIAMPPTQPAIDAAVGRGSPASAPAPEHRHGSGQRRLGDSSAVAPGLSDQPARGGATDLQAPARRSSAERTARFSTGRRSRPSGQRSSHRHS